jgi:hypothetical protein
MVNSFHRRRANDHWHHGRAYAVGGHVTSLQPTHHMPIHLYLHKVPPSSNYIASDVSNSELSIEKTHDEYIQGRQAKSILRWEVPYILVPRLYLKGSGS